MSLPKSPSPTGHHRSFPAALGNRQAGERCQGWPAPTGMPESRPGRSPWPAGPPPPRGRAPREASACGASGPLPALASHSAVGFGRAQAQSARVPGQPEPLTTRGSLFSPLFAPLENGVDAPSAAIVQEIKASWKPEPAPPSGTPVALGAGAAGWPWAAECISLR